MPSAKDSTLQTMAAQIAAGAIVWGTNSVFGFQTAVLLGLVMLIFITMDTHAEVLGYAE